jgi:hypothetical protein
MKVREIPLLICPLLLILGIMACTINVGGPSYPEQHIPVSTAAVAELQSALQTAVAAATQSGQVTLIVTEPQLTSYLADQLQAQNQPVFVNPQVYLQNGQVQIYGTAIQGYFQATIEIVVTAGVDPQGQLKIELTSADFGPLPVPNGLTDTVTGAIQAAYTGAIGPAALGFRLENISVTNGTMTIVARTK